MSPPRTDVGVAAVSMGRVRIAHAPRHGFHRKLPSTRSGRASSTGDPVVPRPVLSVARRRTTYFGSASPCVVHAPPGEEPRGRRKSTTLRYRRDFGVGLHALLPAASSGVACSSRLRASASVRKKPPSRWRRWRVAGELIYFMGSPFRLAHCCRTPARRAHVIIHRPRPTASRYVRGTGVNVARGTRRRLEPLPERHHVHQRRRLSAAFCLPGQAWRGTSHHPADAALDGDAAGGVPAEHRHVRERSARSSSAGIDFFMAWLHLMPGPVQLAPPTRIRAAQDDGEQAPEEQNHRAAERADAPPGLMDRRRSLLRRFRLSPRR